jgi:hypothetical protein
VIHIPDLGRFCSGRRLERQEATLLFVFIAVSILFLVVLNLSFRVPWLSYASSIGLVVLCCVVVVFLQHWNESEIWYYTRPIRQFLILQSLLLMVVSFGGTFNRWKKRYFFAGSMGATLVLYAFLLWKPVLTSFSHAWLRPQFPFESLEDRIPRAKLPTGGDSLPAATLHRLQEQERILESSWRESELAYIHNDHWARFIQNPNFGVGRREAYWSIEKRHLESTHFPKEPVGQPDPSLGSFSYPPLEGAKRTNEKDLSALFGLHQAGSFDFINLTGFGYVKDRSAVAGFETHGFSMAPVRKGWLVRRVDLVGMLLHEQPVVYVTDNLPRMDLVRNVPTRSLDAFESAGLHELEKGEDLYVRESPQGWRMLGSLRSTKQCIKCHAGERGDLLGAFSYILDRQLGQASSQ